MRTVQRREAPGVAGALVLAVLVLAHIAASQRSWVLFYDGDSLLFPLISESLRVGQPQHWALSSALFLPEAAIYLPIGAIGLPVKTTLLLDGLANWLALYAVIRALAAAVRVPRAGRVASALVVLGVVSAFTLLESSASHDALEPASLLATTTYYSGTAVAVIGALALCARALSRPSRPGWAIGLGVVTAVAVLSNPIFLAWAVVPLGAVSVLALASGAGIRRVAAVVGALLAGCALGSLARIPFASLLTEDGTAKIRPDQAAVSWRYYASLLTDRLHTVSGVVALVIVLLLTVSAVAATVRAIRMRWVAGMVIAATAVVGPFLVVGGAIALGTTAARYLEPVVFLAPLVLLAVPGLLPEQVGRFAAWSSGAPRTVFLAGIAVVGVFVAASGITRLAAEASTVDPSIACATRWVAAQDASGAGQFWTVRAIKAYAADPRRLIQVDAYGAGYAWLTNAADLAQRTVSFSITDAASAPFGGALGHPSASVRCGRYTINEYPAPVELGPAHH